MATANANLQIIGYKSGMPSGSAQVQPPLINNTSPVDADTTVNLTTGANTIAIPTNTNGLTAVIVPPAGNAQTLTFKGVTGDTGVAMHLTNASAFSFASSQATFVITAGGTVTGMVIQWV